MRGNVMKKIALVMLLLFVVIVYPNETNASKMPCNLTLEPLDKKLKNAKGMGLIYKVQLNPSSFERTNISILAVHLPEPSSFGDYDSYEGFASIPNEISWRFKLYPTPEEDTPTWAGRFDLITAKMRNTKVEVRLSNSKTKS
ncbi:YoqH [Priestia megaterium WSH-002]|uniref:YoqH n=1 Tax=Priestia megaterium (strain WSH-002) TaxID=1006007 RepID=A0A8D3WX54_PRIMW|nr:YoqH [Priestia megaterium WSH-002]